MAQKNKKCPECEVGAPLWMVTYGDMVTLLLCLFVMLFTTGKATPVEIQLILSAFNNSLGFFDGGQTLSRGRLEEMGMNIESLPSQTTGRSLSRAKQTAQSVFKPEIKAKQVRVTEDERGLVISLVSADYFAPGSAIPNESIEDVLVRVAGLIRQLNRFVRVEGHASRGEVGSLQGSPTSVVEERRYENSWDLAGARAVNTSTFLWNQGVPPETLQAVSFGEFRPLAVVGDSGTPEAAAHNRRIDLVLQPLKDVGRAGDESGFRLPESRIPGNESLVPDQ
ncbi:MAG: flagellar motor protein MotB [bacterium]|nr:flagellar motor protein MotB [bacterium]